MRRWAFNMAALMALLLFVATLALWVRSYWVSDVARWGSRWYVIGLSVTQGELAAMWASGSKRYGYLYKHNFVYSGDIPADIIPAGAATDFFIHRQWPEWAAGTIFVPCWFVLVLLGVVLTLWTVALRRRQMLASSGRCAHCGYDLRASPNRCPECGTLTAAAARQ